MSRTNVTGYANPVSATKTEFFKPWPDSPAELTKSWHHFSQTQLPPGWSTSWSHFIGSPSFIPSDSCFDEGELPLILHHGFHLQGEIKPIMFNGSKLIFEAGGLFYLIDLEHEDVVGEFKGGFGGDVEEFLSSRVWEREGNVAWRSLDDVPH